MQPSSCLSPISKSLIESHSPYKLFGYFLPFAVTVREISGHAARQQNLVRNPKLYTPETQSYVRCLAEDQFSRLVKTT